MSPYFEAFIEVVLMFGLVLVLLFVSLGLWWLILYIRHGSSVNEDCKTGVKS